MCHKATNVKLPLIIFLQKHLLMKAFKLTFLLLALLTVAACDDDDDAPIVCGQSDWVGTFTGTQTCTDEPTEDVTLTFTSAGANLLNFEYTVAGTVTSNTTPIPYDGCSFMVSGNDMGVSLDLEVALQGSELTFTTVTTLTGIGTTTCTINATKN